MNEQIQAIRGWIRNALECETKKAIKQLHNKHFMTDYERGRTHGAISAYQHVLVETSPTSAWKVPYNAFNAWVTDICEHTALTAGEAIEIYNFCESNDLLNMHNVISIIIELGQEGHNLYDIINILKHEAIRQGKGFRAKKWRRKEKDE
jgi:hypothetical protein